MNIKLKVVAAALFAGMIAGLSSQAMAGSNKRLYPTPGPGDLVEVQNYYYFQKPTTRTRYKQGKNRYDVVGHYGKYKGYYSRKRGINDDWTRSGAYLGEPDRLRKVRIIPRNDCVPRYVRTYNCCR